MSQPLNGISKLLSVEKLFELILLNLDMRITLLGQRVQSHWRTAITTSLQTHVKTLSAPLRRFR